mmetsp:Transcript_34880/g.93231  ORF Transcript_34880/g.93231 Transcript_34880/m.93231 type:complete len:199 (+) Transcript_34880:762-1358(+)
MTGPADEQHLRAADGGGGGGRDGREERDGARLHPGERPQRSATHPTPPHLHNPLCFIITPHSFQIDVEVSDFDEWKIKLGFMDDPRIPEECRVDMMTKIKTAGSAGIVSYALTEGFFWLTSIPIAYGTVWASTGSAPDLGDSEGQKAIGAAAFVLINTARVIVPARIAFALAITPWVDDNIMSKFKKEEATTDDCEVP